MKFAKTKKVTFNYEVKYVGVTVDLKYEDELHQEGVPYKLPSGSLWSAVIDIDEKKFLNWPVKKPWKFEFKPRDSGTYILYTPELLEVARLDQEYVPNSLLPGEYGDYLEFDVDENGYILNWLKNPNFDDFKQKD